MNMQIATRTYDFNAIETFHPIATVQEQRFQPSVRATKEQLFFEYSNALQTISTMRQEATLLLSNASGATGSTSFQRLQQETDVPLSFFALAEKPVQDIAMELRRMYQSKVSSFYRDFQNALDLNLQMFNLGIVEWSAVERGLGHFFYPRHFGSTITLYLVDITQAFAHPIPNVAIRQPWPVPFVTNVIPSWLAPHCRMITGHVYHRVETSCDVHLRQFSGAKVAHSSAAALILGPYVLFGWE